jgi:hypothetical protein
VSRERLYRRWLIVWCALVVIALLEVKFPVGGPTLYDAAVGVLAMTGIPLLVFIVIGHLNLADSDRERPHE